MFALVNPLKMIREFWKM